VELEAIKGSEGEEVLLSQLQNIREATPPVKIEKNNKKPITPIHCE
jgi:hypothetical protein